MDKNIVLAFPGSGKTYLVKKYKNIADNDFCYFKFLYDKPAIEMTDEELESKKGNKDIERDNPEYPQNLINATFECLNQGKVVLIPLSKGTYNIFKELDKTNKLQGITVTMIYPAKSDFDNFIKRYQQRGNSDIFMKYNHVVHFNEWVEMFDEEQSFNKINIGSNEYLENILIKLGISLIEK